MTINRKILFVTISVLFISLMISSVVNIVNFRKNYTEALITGSYGLGQSLNSVVSEMLNLGLPLESLAGMDKKVKQLVENNPHISYVAICDLAGRPLFHSDPTLVGKLFSDEVMKKSIVITEPLTQLYKRFDGHDYYDVTLPIFDSGKTRVGIIRLGFRTKVVSDKVWGSTIQVAINFTLSFVLIALLINTLLSRLVSKPIIALSDQARKIADGQLETVVPISSKDEIGMLSGSLNAMASTLKSQIEALKNSRDNLEQQVQARTSELGTANSHLLEKNKELVEAMAVKAALIQRNQVLMDNALDGIHILDEQGNLIEANLSFFHLLGYSREECQHLNATDWEAKLTPDELRLAIRQILDGRALFESLHRRKDGSLMEVEISAVGVELDGRKYLYCTNRDITQRKQAEAELLRSNRELEQFSYSISHDMRQPLRMISSYLQLLEKKLATQLSGEQREYFNFAIDGAKRMDAMMLGLLEYSRVGRKGEPPKWLESRTLVDEALSFLQPAIAEASAAVRIEGEWPRVFVRPDEVMRLLQNLIGNALKFRMEGRMPEIVVSSQTIGNEWHVSVTDNGIGILPDQTGRLFQVFQRLQSRANYEGTGIGLALCRKIVEHHGGRIRVESEGEGMGSRFLVAMPLPTEGEIEQFAS